MTHPGMIVRRLNFTPAAIAKNQRGAAPRPPHISYVDQGERPARVASIRDWSSGAFAPSRVAADLCQVDESAIRAWALAGKVRTTRVKGKLIFRLDDILEAAGVSQDLSSEGSAREDTPSEKRNGRPGRADRSHDLSPEARPTPGMAPLYGPAVEIRTRHEW